MPESIDTSDDTTTGVKTIKQCECCGQDFETTVGVRGRPRVYCQKKCKTLAGLWPFLEDLLGDADFNPTKDKAKLIRKHLWSIGNRVYNHHSE